MVMNIYIYYNDILLDSCANGFDSLIEFGDLDVEDVVQLSVTDPVSVYDEPCG